MHRENDTNLAPYAIRAADCGGRTHTEPDDPLWGPFELDRHRIISSTAFRRLDRKTQVFAGGVHDHFRTRLTHTLEATHIARALAVALQANEALAEAITLAHDLGHPPFGHAGEAALGDLMSEHGGFNHNAHSLRVVEYLEHPYPAFRGLNLTVETRAGLAAHETRYDVPKTPNVGSIGAGAISASDERSRGLKPAAQDDAPRGLKPAAPGNGAREEVGDEFPLGATVEARIASMADRIAYNLHDLEDAIGAELIGPVDLDRVRLWASARESLKSGLPPDSIHAVRRPILDAILTTLLTDVVQTSLPLLTPLESPADARGLNPSPVALSDELDASLRELEALLAGNVYAHPAVAEGDAQAGRIIRDLFDHYRREPAAMPTRFASRTSDQDLDHVICDYIAGMTDRFCRSAHGRLVGSV